MNTKDRQVFPSMELLSEMEAVQIYGGIGQPQNDPDGNFICIKGHCDEAKCSNCATNCAKCDCTVDQPKSGTDCTVVKAIDCGS